MERTCKKVVFVIHKVKKSCGKTSYEAKNKLKRSDSTISIKKILPKSRKDCNGNGNNCVKNANGNLCLTNET